MQEVLIPTTTSSQFENASSHIKNRSLLYDKDKNVLFVKYANEMRPISCKVDNNNIILNDNGEVALSDDVQCKTLTVKPDDSGLVYKDNVVFANTSDTKRIILLFKITNTENVGTIGGKFYELGQNITSGLTFSASVSGSRSLSGSSTGEMPTCCKCVYQNTEYLGIKFNPNTTIYFSGYDCIQDSYTINFDYEDNDFSQITDLVDVAETHKTVIYIENASRTDWDFLEYIDGLDSDNSTTSNTQYDLGNGLTIDSGYNGTVTFFPKINTDGNKGYVRLNGSGRAFKLTTSTTKIVSLNISFTSSTGLEENNVVVYNRRGTVLSTLQTNKKDSISTLKVSGISTNSTYYIGSTSSSVDIYRISLILDNTTIAPGWDAYEYHWDFKEVPSGWISGVSTDFGNGLSLIRTDNNVSLETGSVVSSDTGCIKVTPNTNGNPILALKVKRNGAKLRVLFASASSTLLWDNSVTCTLYGPDGSNLGSATASSKSSLTTLTVSNLGVGKYEITASRDLKVFSVYLSGDVGPDTVIHHNDATIDKVYQYISFLPENGEDSEPTLISLRDVELDLADLTRINSLLRDSDRPIHLDLSECVVADDAKVWDATFYKCTSLTYLAMPQGVTEIRPDAFVGCLFLKKIVMCDSIEQFTCDSVNHIFSGTLVRTHVLPKNLKKIQWITFADSGTRNIIVQPDCTTRFINMLENGSFFGCLDYVRIYMTQTEYESHDWTLQWEHNNYFGDNADQTIAQHIIVYDDYNKLIDTLKYRSIE